MLDILSKMEYFERMETINDITGTWAKYNNRWMVAVPRQIMADEGVMEERPVIGGGTHERIVQYVTVESRDGRKSVVEIGEYETKFNRNGKEVYIYSIV